MQNHDVEFTLSRMNWLGQSIPVLSNKILADPIGGKDATLETKILIFFDGASLHKLKVAEAVGTRIIWNNYGELRLKEPEPKVHPKLIDSILSLLSAAVGGIPSNLRDAYRGFSEVYKGAKGQDELVKLNWNLAFDKENKFKNLQGLVVGKCSYKAKRYSPESKQAIRIIEEYQKYAGIKLKDYLKAHLPEFLYVEVNYKIPKEIISKVFQNKVRSKDYPSIVLRTNIDRRFLNPNTAEELHRIYCITAIDGNKIVIGHPLDFRGPKYKKIIIADGFNLKDPGAFLSH